MKGRGAAAGRPLYTMTGRPLSSAVWIGLGALLLAVVFFAFFWTARPPVGHAVGPVPSVPTVGDPTHSSEPDPVGADKRPAVDEPQRVSAQPPPAPAVELPLVEEEALEGKALLRVRIIGRASLAPEPLTLEELELAPETRELLESDPKLRRRLFSHPSMRPKVQAGPIEGARVLAQPVGGKTDLLVEVTQSRGTPEEALRTDFLGEVQFEVSAGRAYRVLANLDGVPGRSELEVAPLAVAELRHVTLDLSTGPDLVYHGVVLSEDGEALQASVRVFQRGRSLARLRADEEGRFEVLSDTWRAPRMRISAPGYSPLVVPVSPGFDDPEKPEHLVLAKGVQLAVTVLAPTTLPVPGAVVEARVDRSAFTRSDALSAPGTSKTGLVAKAGTNNKGQAVLRGLPTGVPILLTVRGHPFGSFRDSVPPLATGEEREVVLVHPRASRIAGVVVDQEERALPGIELWLRRVEGGDPHLMTCVDRSLPFTVANGRGEFSFDGVYPGKYQIGASRECTGGFGVIVPPSMRETKNTHGVGGLPTTVVLPVGEALEDAVVRLERELWIVGRTVHEDGRPAVLADVIARREEPGEGAPPAVQTDGGGSFRIGPCSDGSFSIVARLPGFRSRARSVSPVMADEATEEGEGIELVVHPTGWLEGVVVQGWDGEPAGAQLIADGKALGMSDSRTGVFGFEVPREGTFELHARDSPLAGKTRVFVPSFESDVRGLRIELWPSGRTEIQIYAYPLEESLAWMVDADWTAVFYRDDVVAHVESFRGLRHEFIIDWGTYRLELWADLLERPWVEQVTFEPDGAGRLIRFNPSNYR